MAESSRPESIYALPGRSIVGLPDNFTVDPVADSLPGSPTQTKASLTPVKQVHDRVNRPQSSSLLINELI
jgi:hypothetical protein